MSSSRPRLPLVAIPGGARLPRYPAKRLLAALSMSVQRHEAVFGVLETDINKRLRMPQATG